MKVKSIQNNVTEIGLPGAIVLVSYETPVAVLDLGDGVAKKTAEFHSNTTSRHINAFFARHAVHHNETIEVPQCWFDDVLEANTGL